MLPQRVETPDGISWYIERFDPHDDTSDRSNGEFIILIPSGEGDCQSLRKLASLLATKGQFSVLTFDTPGFSRSYAPPEAYSRVTPQLLAGQIIGLLDQLCVQRATFFGCSSGGGATLALCALYSSRVKCGIVHEVPLDQSEVLLNMQKMSDGELVEACQKVYADGLIEQDVNEGSKKWEALGVEYHERLTNNYVRWVRGYVNAVELGSREIAIDPANLQRRPIFWTVGSLNPGAEDEKGIWKSNFELAKNAGLVVDAQRLRSLHFPTVTVPEDLATWICECVRNAKN